MTDKLKKMKRLEKVCIGASIAGTGLLFAGVLSSDAIEALIGESIALVSLLKGAYTNVNRELLEKMQDPGFKEVYENLQKKFREINPSAYD